MMKASPDKRAMTVLVWSMVWAIAFIGSAIVFKGSPVKEWIQSTLFIVGLTAWLLQSRRTTGLIC
jgi:hypothetical protein